MNKIVVLQDKKIGKRWYDEERSFSVVDVLTESKDEKDYWYILKKKKADSGGVELSTFCRKLKLCSSYEGYNMGDIIGEI